jgi:hypothetical protein
MFLEPRVIARASPASPRPSRRLARVEPVREFEPLVAADAWRRHARGGGCAGEIAKRRLAAPRRRRLDTRLLESAT